VSDDDLWIVATDGGPARRMTWTGPDVAKLIGRKGGAMPRFDKRPNLARKRLPARRGRAPI